MFGVDDMALAVLGTGVLSSVMGYNSAQATNKMQMSLAEKQMAWQKMMSDTAHQREVADLEAAGLNPVLSATGGSGASTPGGTMAQLMNPYEAITNSAKATGEYFVNRALADKLNVEKEKSDVEKESEKFNLKLQKGIYGTTSRVMNLIGKGAIGVAAAKGLHSWLTKGKGIANSARSAASKFTPGLGSPLMIVPKAALETNPYLPKWK